MAIKVRRGLEVNFDKTKLVGGEPCITTDTKKAFITFAPNDTKQLLTSEDSNDIIALSETMEQQIADFEQLEIDKVGINDSTATLTQAYSGSKTQGLIDEVNTNLDTKADKTAVDLKANQTDLVVERNRITNLATLTAGSTTGDAELIDGRVDANGVVNASIGGNIRSIGKGNIDFSTSPFMLGKTKQYLFSLELGTHTSTGLHDSTIQCRTKSFISGGKTLIIYSTLTSYYYWLVKFNLDGTYVSDTVAVLPSKLTLVLDGAYKYKFMFRKVDGSTLSVQTVLDGVKYVIDGQDDLPASFTHKNPASLVLPVDNFCASGIQQQIFYDNLIKDGSIEDYAYVQTAITANTGSEEYSKRSIAITGIDTITADTWATLSFKDRITKEEVLNGYIKTAKVLSTAGSGLTKKCMFIGDSNTWSGIYVKNLLTMFSTDAMKIESIGTLVAGGLNVNHEGRAGWNTKHYCTVASYGGFTNAFWNPATSKFDFSYYMSHNGFASVDYVFINLGTNDQGLSSGDLTDTEIIQYRDEIIASIKLYNANARIGLWLCPIPSMLNTQQSYVRKQKILNINKLIINKYSGKMTSDRLYVVPVYLNIDTLTDYTIIQKALSSRNAETFPYVDNYLHPHNIGIQKIADVLFSWIKYMGSQDD